MARQICSRYSTSVHVFESGMGYRRHACTYPRFRLLKIVHFVLTDEVNYITPSVKELSEVVRWPKWIGTWRSSAYPSARHCVIKAIPHLVYQVKTTIFSSWNPAKRRLWLQEPTTYFQTCDETSNIVWIFTVPHSVPTSQYANEGSGNN